MAAGRSNPRTCNAASCRCPWTTTIPHGAKITLGFNRLPAADRAHRVGSLIINPGGPGGAGSEFVAGGGGRRPSLEPRPARALRHDRHGPAWRRHEHAGPVRPRRLQPAGVAVSQHGGAVRPAGVMGARVRSELPGADRPAARPRGHAQRRARHGGAAPGARRREAELPRALLRRAPRLRVRRAVPEAHPHDGARCHRQPLRLGQHAVRRRGGDV